jgi:hypothetical protein
MNKKLSEQQVIEIFLSEEPTSIIAAVYGLSTNSVRSIKRRHTYQEITQQRELFPSVQKVKTRKPILDDDTVIAIYKFTGSISKLKEKFGVSKKVAQNIKFGFTYRSITEEIRNIRPPGEIKLHSLTWDDVCAIRASSLSQSILASLFNVSNTTISNIKLEKTRKFK